MHPRLDLRANSMLSASIGNEKPGGNYSPIFAATRRFSPNFGLLTSLSTWFLSRQVNTVACNDYSS
jgi:hypothetical protein